MTLINPKLVLTFQGGDLEPGHETEQTIDCSWLVNRTAEGNYQLLNGLKSSSDTMKITIFRRCPTVEDIIATDGNILVRVYDGDQLKWTGFLSTNYQWAVTDHGEQYVICTLESMGTRLFNRTFIETGYYFFDCAANAAVYAVISSVGITMREGDERKILQPVRMEVDSKMNCRQILDQLLYECNSVYWFNTQGELCISNIDVNTVGAQTISSDHLFTVGGKAISLSKSLRTYKGARVQYTETANAQNYLVYRNTTGQDDSHPFCNLKLGAGEYFDGAEIFTAAEWSEATADQFREPTLIGACNADSESSIVGSGEIMAISNIEQNVSADAGITVEFEHVGGKWFKLIAHNATAEDKYIHRLDLYANIVYIKSNGVIRTQITGPVDGKAMLEEELSWIHDKYNAQRHANLLADYNKSCGAQYSFYSDLDITLGTVVKLHETVFSGLEVFVLVYAKKSPAEGEIYEYKAVGVSTFDLDQPAYHGTTETGKQSGKQGPKGDPGPTTEVQYAIGSSILYPPGDAMMWGSAEMLWGDDPMFWNSGTWGDNVPVQERGKYVWMRTRVGDGPWQYSRLTGSTSWDPENLGVCTNACPTQSESGLGLIPGDYFVAGNNFTDPVDGHNYEAGCAYYYDGAGWTGLDIDSADNAKKVANLLSSIISSGVQIPESASPYSTWKWVKNFAALNALIVNLFTHKITVLDNGCIHSEYYDDDGNPKLTASISKVGSGFSVALDIETFLAACGNIAGTYKWICDDTNSFWDRATGNPLYGKTTAGMADYGITITGTSIRYDEITVTVHPAVGTGFWLGANGLLKCENAEVHGDIKADSFAFGNVGLKWGYKEINSTTNIDLTTEYGMTTGDMVTVQAAWMDGTPQPFSVPNFSFILDDGARGLDHEVTLYNNNGVTIKYIRGLYGVFYGLRVETSKDVKLFIQAFHNSV